jgi:hemoglobin
LKRRVEPFLAMALGGPNEYHGPSLRRSHTHLVAKGMDDSVFDAFLGHFGDVLKELGVPEEKLAEIVPIFLGARSDVLNR